MINLKISWIRPLFQNFRVDLISRISAVPIFRRIKCRGNSRIWPKNTKSAKFYANKVFSSFIFKEYWCRWHWKRRGFSRLVFIDEECENLRVVIEGKEVTRIVKRSQWFYKPIDVYSVINTKGKIVSSIRMWNNVNQISMIFLAIWFLLWVGSKQFEEGNHLDLILSRADRNCCTMENLRDFSSALNEIFQ